MNDASRSPLLEILARRFREAGDCASAEALEGNAVATRRRELDVDDAVEASRLTRTAMRLNNRGDHEAAEPLFLHALAIHETNLGVDHPDTWDSLGALASCRCANGDFGPARDTYARLLRALEANLEPDDALIAATRWHLRRCEKGLRDDAGSRVLQRQMTWMLQTPARRE